MNQILVDAKVQFTQNMQTIQNSSHHYLQILQTAYNMIYTDRPHQSHKNKVLINSIESLAQAFQIISYLHNTIGSQFESLTNLSDHLSLVCNESEEHFLEENNKLAPSKHINQNPKAHFESQKVAKPRDKKIFDEDDKENAGINNNCKSKRKFIKTNSNENVLNRIKDNCFVEKSGNNENCFYPQILNRIIQKNSLRNKYRILSPENKKLYLILPNQSGFMKRLK